MGADQQSGTRHAGPHRSVVGIFVVVGILAAGTIALTMGVLVALVVVVSAALGVAAGRIQLEASHRGDRALTEEALRESEGRFRTLAASAPLGIFQLDGAGRVTYANDRWLELDPDACAAADPDVPVRDVWTCVHHEDRAAMAGRWSKAMRRGDEFRARFRLTAPDGSRRWVIGRTAPMRTSDGAVTGHVGMVLEVNDLVEARQNLLRFQSIIEMTTDFVGITDGRGRPLYLNAAARQVLGMSNEDDLRRFDPRAIYTENSWRTITREAMPAVRRGEVWRGELSLRRPDNRGSIPISNVVLAQRQTDGTIDFIATIARDTSEQKRLEARLQHEAEHDRLTGLPNRGPFLDWVNHAIDRGLDDPVKLGKVAVLFSDIDRFKVVNDSLGHDVGDQLLTAMSRRLVAAVRPNDRVARFGGDEFVVLCAGVSSAAEAAEIAERVRRDVGGRFSIADHEVFVTLSIGVAIADEGRSGEGGDTAEDLLRDADAAMYDAKARGRDRVQVFDASVRTEVVERLDIEQALRYAIERDELILEFQPIIELPSGRVNGVEALVRWRHPERGLLQPSQFLRVAEETGVILDLGRWVLTEACATARRVLFDPETGDPIPVFVNLSARQLVDSELVTMVQEVIDLTGVDAGAVHLEITEDALMADAATTSTTLASLREIGVRLALDDFGTGHSSLAYLKQFPVEILKIDRTFIEGLDRDPGDRAITAAIVNVARMLGLSTVAEGVERADQAAELAALGCHLAQGFHFARPMSEADLAEMLPHRGGPGATSP